MGTHQSWTCSSLPTRSTRPVPRQPPPTLSSSHGPAHFLTPLVSEPLVLLGERPGWGGVRRDL